jgi:hypothetical protein
MRRALLGKVDTLGTGLAADDGSPGDRS